MADTSTRCPDCRRPDGQHRANCWRLCPTCLSGTVVAYRRSINEPGWRGYSCGHEWRSPEMLLVDAGYRRAQAREREHQLAETRRIAREFLTGQRLLVEQGRVRWLGEVLMPHKRHLGRYGARINLVRSDQTGDGRG